MIEMRATRDALADFIGYTPGQTSGALGSKGRKFADAMAEVAAMEAVANAARALAPLMHSAEMRWASGENMDILVKARLVAKIGRALARLDALGEQT